MSCRPVFIFDSGAGGLPYLDSIRSLLPHEVFVYLSDRAGFPYGTKTREEVEVIVRDRMNRMIARFDPKIVVIACNTASQAALDAVRRDHPERPIVGTVPAVKPAAARTKSGTIAVLATKRAAVDPYLTELIAKFAPGVNVLRIGAQDLVTFVERRLFLADERERLDACRSAIAEAVDGGADQIVLACTHFLHIAGDIARAAGPGIAIVDSREGVARRTAWLVDSLGRAAAGAERDPDGFWVTGEPPYEPSHRQYAAKFGLEFMGSIDGIPSP
ncbi:MAG: glutamate racemase [Spirochaetes bacterium]|nr:glutamate racemase [Spirochaetota bacterium]